MLVAVALSWYLSLRWMLTTDPSPYTFRALLPMLTFTLVASVTGTYLIVATGDAITRRLRR